MPLTLRLFARRAGGLPLGSEVVPLLLFLFPCGFVERQRSGVTGAPVSTAWLDVVVNENGSSCVRKITSAAGAVEMDLYDRSIGADEAAPAAYVLTDAQVSDAGRWHPARYAALDHACRACTEPHPSLEAGRV